MVTVSIIIRTYNESRYLGELLQAIEKQKVELHNKETIIVDSGSTDSTLAIAEQYKCHIVNIPKSKFSFGRSLNVGCALAKGDILVFISGHCIPTDENWLGQLIAPILAGKVHYCYGRQIGRQTTKFSEQQIFEKYFPQHSKIPQKDYFCNNANAALSKSYWSKYLFDEEITGLEDMLLARQIQQDGGFIGYVAAATVFHIHHESWYQVLVRYEREGYALRNVMPQVSFDLIDFFSYFFLGVYQDYKAALTQKVWKRHFIKVIFFRFMQYWGTYLGSRKDVHISMQMKRKFFYPKDME